MVTGRCSLEELNVGPITLIAPFANRKGAVSQALKKRHGLGFPAANRMIPHGKARIIWFGPGQAMVLGPRLARVSGAATSDQSDGWAVLRLSGTDAGAVLARLVPIDLRPGIFRNGHTARTLLGHMPVSLSKVAADSFDLMVFRSTGPTAVHEITRAMASVAAQLDGSGG